MMNEFEAFANELRQAGSKTKPHQAKPGVKKSKQAKPQPQPKNLPRVLTCDPWETLGVELHISVVTCSHCGKVHRAPLTGTNTLTRRVRKRTTRTPHERIVNGPQPWVSTSVPQKEEDWESWRNSIPMDWAQGYETVEHHSSCVRCENCTTKAKVPDNTGQLHLGLNYESKAPTTNQRGE
jgi:hypothetical protein